MFDSQQITYFHSHFCTDWFADLNYGPVDQAGESPAYQAIADAAKGWIARGVDGLRLDAVKHIYHSETSEENPRFLKMFYEDMNAYYKQKGHTDDFYMVGEVLSEYDKVAPYYKGLPALLNFPSGIVWNGESIIVPDVILPKTSFLTNRNTPTIEAITSKQRN